MKTLLIPCLALMGCLCAKAAFAEPFRQPQGQSYLSNVDANLASWVTAEQAVALHGLLANISPADAARGAVVASPSRQNPDYFYHWVRDAALVMNHVIERYGQSRDTGERQAYIGMIWDYINFSRGNQMTPNRSGGLGEPKFNADGSAFNGDWGRPQNDGPALRALALLRFAKLLLAENGGEAVVRARLYDGKIPTETVIKADLEFVSHHWREANFDIWEEVLGSHFYNLLAYRSAMVEGAALAERMNDIGAAAWYRQQAAEIGWEAQKFWRPDLGYIEVTRDRRGGLDYKHTGLDVAVILAALHSDIGDGFFDVADDRVLATAQKLESTFAAIYPLNGDTQLGVAIGRYPEDRYDGYRTDREGNPWFLATLAYAELYYRLYQKIALRGDWQVTETNLSFLRSLLPADTSLASGQVISAKDEPATFASLLAAIGAKGDGFMRRVHQHAARDGRMAEQFSRYHGYMQGAADLTWSYAAFLTAAYHRP